MALSDRDKEYIRKYRKELLEKYPCFRSKTIYKLIIEQAKTLKSNPTEVEIKEFLREDQFDFFDIFNHY